MQVEKVFRIDSSEIFDKPYASYLRNILEWEIHSSIRDLIWGNTSDILIVVYYTSCNLISWMTKKPKSKWRFPTPILTEKCIDISWFESIIEVCNDVFFCYSNRKLIDHEHGDIISRIVKKSTKNREAEFWFALLDRYRKSKVFDFKGFSSILSLLSLVESGRFISSSLIFMSNLLCWVSIFFGREITMSTRKVRGRERRKLLRNYRV